MPTHLSPYEEMQRFKTHPATANVGGRTQGRRWGAAINEGGLQAVPKLAFLGGCLIGCSAGFVNVSWIKGKIYNAMKTAMLAAEAAFKALKGDVPMMN